MPASELDGALEQLLRALCETSPEAVAGSKRLIRETAGIDYRQADARAIEIGMATDAAADAVEGMAAFREKRRPNWPSLGNGGTEVSHEDDR